MSEYSKHLDVVETAIERGAQDAMGETRSMSRIAFAAYSRAAPERAVALLRRFDGGLQEKLAAAASSYEPGAIPRAGEQAIRGCLLTCMAAGKGLCVLFVDGI